MTENNQLSDETKNNSTDTSSTDASSAVIGNHENAVVPHKISNHDKLVQTMVMVDGEWINVNDTNDQANMKEDMHKVNKKVVEAQKGIVEAKNTADSAIKYADSAVSASKVNSAAIVAQSSAISEAKAAAGDAASKARFIKENASSEAAAIRNQVADVANNVSSMKADVASATSDVANLKVDVQANSAAIIKTNDAVKIQSKNSSDAINELKIANGQVESIAKDAKNNAVFATQTATSATVEATNASSAATKAELSVNGLTTRVTAIEGDNKKLSNQIASTETILQQTKDQLLQKADKSIVDQANNLISQLSAEQKIMAGQIEQKASSTELDNALTSINKNTTAIDENSKAIKLKADATEVNNLKGTVNSHSASINLFSNQLKSMVTESKVNDIINGKGFATQSYTQSIVNQKSNQWNATIVGLTQQINNSSDVNLAQKTNQGTTNWSVSPGNGTTTISEVNINGIRGVRFTQIKKSTTWWVIAYTLNLDYFEPNQDYIISFDVRTSSDNFNQGGMLNIARGDSSHAYLANTSFKTNFKQNQLTHVACTGRSYGSLDKNGETFYLNCLGLGQCDWVDIVNLKIARGTIDKGYSPAPSDIATTTQLTTMQASIDGLQSAVKNKVDQSQYTQLAGVVQTKVSQSDFNRLNNQVNVQTLDSANIDNMKTTGHYFVRNLTGNPIGGWVYVDVTGNANDRIRQDVYQDSGTKHAFRRWFGSYWTGWSTGAEESEITQLRSDINLRVKSGDLLSQINIAAGHTLIQSNKIYFDADSFVMSPNSKAFIPSAYITDINADKITTGTLDAAKFNVKNFSADNIVGGTLSGVVVKTGANDRYFQTSKDNIYWVRKGSMSLVGNDTYLNSANGLNIADEKNIQLTTWGGATVNKDGSITNDSGNSGHPKIVIDDEGKYNPDDIYGSAFGGGPGDSEIAQWVGNKEYTVLTRNQGFTVRLNDGNNKSVFAIQKDNKVGFYVGGGDDGGEIRIAGAGPIKLQGKYLDDGFNDGMTHTLGNLQVDNLHVRKWLGVDQSKNAIVKTSQGPVTINAYETAEYYFGDIGEGQTSTDGIAYIGIEKLFNETVNTTIPYHVFITAYGAGNIWVDQREHNRFIVKSDQPNLKFSWEIKAKRKGYEQTRLQNVNDKLNHMAATS
ncbi:pyocin knob domain-containing protein [Limosilactobacillus reuteri]|uniref:pyocin knob domain-containing protein n=1 Tax=Limosilactobacillus reuteri TaxID=1598 RepID=UPI0013E91840|nr:pyocin knob domain-containing protein [Limosilactobacillus reuteri]